MQIITNPLRYVRCDAATPLNQPLCLASIWGAAVSVTGIQASRYLYLHITGELEGSALWRLAGRNIQPVAQYENRCA